MTTEPMYETMDGFIISGDRGQRLIIVECPTLAQWDDIVRIMPTMLPLLENIVKEGTMLNPENLKRLGEML